VNVSLVYKPLFSIFFYTKNFGMSGTRERVAQNRSGATTLSSRDPFMG
jgi:hypothetical protein